MMNFAFRSEQVEPIPVFSACLSCELLLIDSAPVKFEFLALS